MIVADEAVFPNNVVELVKLRVPGAIDPDVEVVLRPIQVTDPIQTVGVYAALWTPNEDSYEMGSEVDPKSPHEPTLQDYTVTIQGLIKDTDVERGLATHSVLSARIRWMLYRDRPLRVGFGALVAQVNGATERLTRWGIRSQRYNSNELEGDWYFLSSLELWIETETV